LAWGRKKKKTECGDGGIKKARTVDGAAGSDFAQAPAAAERPLPKQGICSRAAKLGVAKTSLQLLLRKDATMQQRMVSRGKNAVLRDATALACIASFEVGERPSFS